MNERAPRIPGILAVVATYVYFLLYAQFGFLQLWQLRFGQTPALQFGLAAMGAAGWLTSLGLAARLRQQDPLRWLALGLLGCAASAILAVFTTVLWLAVLVAAAIGASTAGLTVALATDLRRLLPGPRFGLAVGAGTGIAYFSCNLPFVFAASPQTKSWLVAAICLGVWGWLRRTLPQPAPATTAPGLPPQPSPEPAGLALVADDYRGLSFVSWVLAFLALIWLDSAAFAIIQETAALQQLTWGSAGQKLIQGTVHGLAALGAGWWIDRGGFRSLLFTTFILFTAAFSLLAHGTLLTLAGPLYAVGISLYSTALVVYPSYLPDAPGLVPRRLRAGIIYGIAGWLGSALGVGMAQHLHHIPRWFLVLTGSLLVAGWALAARGRRAWRQVHGITASCGIAALGFYFLLPALAPASAARLHPQSDDRVQRGRAVYIAEGCIHCHSQYIRPHSQDPQLWGPYRPTERTPETDPPLYGNRRQGPDLTNVGCRRSRAWQELHLRDPRALQPSSRMPSYAYLFSASLFSASNAAGSTRGDDLVAYLLSLGQEQSAACFALTQQASLHPAHGSSAAGRQLFTTYCAPCHGAAGRGDGPLASALVPSGRPAPAAMNLRKGRFWLISWGDGAEPEAQALARVIKYGINGTSMPGHETLSERELADLVAYLLELRGAPDELAGESGP